MDDPYQEEQEIILSRIIGRVEKINESMLELNRSIEQVNGYNASIAEVTELWSTYMRNVTWNLKNQNELHPPV
ncbi:hypothetical protein JCM8115_000092 [Rhodotorula mucilaginosa]|uniref:DASH complex subunit DAD4 n=1 Tax=Rhodotorula mucilaginosa TaxID=5537 RepID=A0A9P7B1Y6_RHOMI|nr:hypothetical protein C6P46_001997 [Rhodotorula mucilaginosa]KWU46993.1 DASH complex, subunit Dad4 [Rhodotorula sp. JG-1b]